MSRVKDILRSMNYLHPKGATFEICGIRPKKAKSRLWEGFAGGPKAIVAGWFKTKKEAAKTVVKLDQEGFEGIYISLNSCDPALLARADHRMKAGVSRTKDHEIKKITNFPIDIDPRRPEGTSSTKKQHKEAIALANTIKSYLEELGWPEPLTGDSGNGAHLIYKVNLENTQANVDILKQCLQAISKKFTTEELEVDESVFNPARLFTDIGVRLSFYTLFEPGVLVSSGNATLASNQLSGCGLSRDFARKRTGEDFP